MEQSQLGQIEPQSKKLVDQFLDDFEDDVSQELRKTAREYASNAELHSPINRAPSTIAAACIYIAGLVNDERIEQLTIVEFSGVSQPSILNCYTEICEHRGLNKDRLKRYAQTNPESADNRRTRYSYRGKIDDETRDLLEKFIQRTKLPLSEADGVTDIQSSSETDAGEGGGGLIGRLGCRK